MIVPAGQSFDFNIRLRRDGAGTHQGSVTIESSSAGSPAFSFSVRGTVEPTADIVVTREDGSDVTSGSTVRLLETGVGVPRQEVFTIRNNGVGLALAIGNSMAMLSGPPAWSVTEPLFAPNEPTEIPPGEARSFTLQLLSTAAGLYLGTIMVQSNDPDTSSFVFPIEGEVGLPDFTVGVSPGTRSIKQGQQARYTVIVHDKFGYTGPVSLSAANLPTGSTAQFTPATLYPGGERALALHLARPRVRARQVGSP